MGDPSSGLTEQLVGGSDAHSEHREVSLLLTELRLSRAAELARSGAYPEAESLLRMYPPSELPIAGLDLLARICAQQGRLEEARGWWEEVLKRDPENRPARLALEKLGQVQASDRDGHAGGRRWWAALKHRFFAKLPAPRQTHALEVQVPGLQVRTEGDKKLSITFEFHPFGDAGAGLNEKGKKALSLLGWQLEPWVGKISIEIVGQPDHLPETLEALPADVAALGMTRAYAVFNHLVQTTKLQARMFSLRTGEEFLSLLPSHTSPEASLQCPPILLRVFFLSR